MELKLKILKDICGRNAANLVFKLAELKDIRITKNGRTFNGKSMLGILANKLTTNDNIIITLEDVYDKDKAIEAFENLAQVI